MFFRALEKKGTKGAVEESLLLGLSHVIGRLRSSSQSDAVEMLLVGHPEQLTQGRNAAPNSQEGRRAVGSSKVLTFQVERVALLRLS